VTWSENCVRPNFTYQRAGHGPDIPRPRPPNRAIQPALVQGRIVGVFGGVVGLGLSVALLGWRS